MAIICELDREGWEMWVKTRPAAIQDLCRRFPPDRLYRLKRDDGTPGHRVTIASYSEHEDGTVGFQVDVTGEYNLVAFSRRVFGIPADGLEECDLPAPDEQLGDAEMPVGAVRAYMLAEKEPER